MQKIITKNHGTIEFVKTWVDGNIHLGLCSDGSYHYIGGPIVKNKNDFSAIHSDEERKAAEEWYEETYVRGPERAQQETAKAEPVKTTIEGVMDAIDEAKAKLANSRYVCQVCGKQFSNGAALYGHMKTHKNETEDTKALDTEG